MFSRRHFLSRSSLGLAAVAGTCLGFQGDEPGAGGDDPRDRVPDGSASKGMIDDQTDRAIQRGLAFLHTHRAREGSFGTGQYRGNVAISSLAAMAFMCAGHQPNRGPYGRLIL